MKKIIIVSALALTSTLSMAQSTATGNMDISANAMSGCTFSAEDFNFGQVDYVTAQNLTKNVTIQCSKGTALELTQRGVGSGPEPLYSSGYSNNYMTLNGQGTFRNTSSAPFALRVFALPTNSDYTVTRYPLNNRLGVRSYQASFYYLGLKIVSGNEFKIPVTAALLAVPYSRESGNYADTVTYTLTY